MAKNNFPLSAIGLYSDGFAVTPDNDTDLVQLPQALWIGGTGNIAVTLPSGNVSLLAVPAGTLLPVRASRVLATGTTATSIVALV